MELAYGEIIQSIIILIIGGIIGAYISNKKDKAFEEYKHKVALYKEILTELGNLKTLDFFGLEGHTIKETLNHERKIIYNIESKAYLFASKEVIQSIWNMALIVSEFSNSEKREKPSQREPINDLTYDEEYLLDLGGELTSYIHQLQSNIRKDLNLKSINRKEMAQELMES